MDAKIGQQFLDVGQLHSKLFRHAFSIGFVRFHGFVPESRFPAVKGNGNAVRLNGLHMLEINIHKPIDCMGVDSFLIGKRTNSIVGTV